MSDLFDRFGKPIITPGLNKLFDELVEFVYDLGFMEGLKEEQAKSRQKLEEMRARLLAEPNKPGNEAKLKFVEQALGQVNSIL